MKGPGERELWAGLICVRAAAVESDDVLGRQIGRADCDSVPLELRSQRIEGLEPALHDDDFAQRRRAHLNLKEDRPGSRQLIRDGHTDLDR